MKWFTPPAAALAAALAAAPLPAFAAPREAAPQPPAAAASATPADALSAARAEDDLAARRLVQRANELLTAGDTERAVKMYESVLEQFPASAVRYEAMLGLGRHYLNNHEAAKAVGYLARLRDLDKPDQEMSPEQRELVAESLYLTGVAHFQSRQYAQAFPVLRKVTASYPNSVWSNQAYYYVGMCHFAQGNWNRAIEALTLVGTFVDPDGPAVNFVEAGHTLYIKVADNDLPVLQRLGRQPVVEAKTAAGDRVTASLQSLADRQGLCIAAIPTEVGPLVPNDHILQITGGDTIIVRYLDDNTREGAKDLPREKTVRIVSTGSLAFTLGNHETRAVAAFLGQPLHLVLRDADLDTSPGRDNASVKLVSRYRSEEDAPAGDAGPEEASYKIRDEVTLALAELGDAPVRTGRFAGAVRVQPWSEGQPIDKNDDLLTAALGDEVVATYLDDLHIAGQSPRQVVLRLRTGGEIDSSPRATQNVVTDPLLKARKDLVEATAYLELARIFKSMGLSEGAAEKAAEGLVRVDQIIAADAPLPTRLKEEAFQTKWELYIVQENYGDAIATCQLFNRLFPDSPLVDQALMGIARIKSEARLFPEAIAVYQQVLALKTSQAKAEAQFRIAQAMEEQINQTRALAKSGQAQPMAAYEPAILQYRLCAQRYPDSAFAGDALAKLVSYHVATKDFAQANDLLDQVFKDHPDAQFLDKMLAVWVTVSFRMGDYQRAYDKCSQLLFEYPNSPYAEEARKNLPRIEERLKK